MSFVKVELEDRIFYITLNRPDKRNALNNQMVNSLKEAFSRAAKEEDARVIVLRSTGNTFCSGADLEYLQQMQEYEYDENLADSTQLMELFRDIYFHPKPVIAQVEGFAIAGGCGLATVCDFVFATPAAKFGYTEARIGFVPAIVMFFLIRKLGEGKARELLIRGNLIIAEEAKSAGLVNQIAEAGSISTEVKDFARELAVNSSGESIRIIKTMIGEIQHLEAQEALLYAARCNALARETDDCRLGIDAFLNKRELKW